MGGWALWTWWTSYNAVGETTPIDAIDGGRGDAVTEAADRLVSPQG